MSYQTQLISPTSNHKGTSQGPHRLSGSSRWWKPVLKLKILFTVTTHLYIDVITSLKTQKPNSDPYKLSKTTTPNTTTPSTAKTRTGMMIYMINTIYNFGKMTTRQQMMRMPVILWILSRALIEPRQPNFDAIKDQPHAEETEATSGLLDETAFIHVLVTKEGEPAYIPLSANLGLKYKKRMLYFPMDFGELTIDGLIDTGAHSSAIPGSRPQENTPTGAPIHSQRGTCPDVSYYGRKRTIGNPKEHCWTQVRSRRYWIPWNIHSNGKTDWSIIGLMLLQRNHTVLDMRQGILNFPYFSMQLKTADHKYSNVLEPILNPDDITILPNDRTLVEIKSQIYNENTVTGVLQPSDLLHEEGDITFCAAVVTLTNGNVNVHINNFTDQPYKLKKGLHIANFSVLTPEQMKHVKPIDPVSTWHLLNENEEDAIYYVSSLLKANRNNDQYEQYWFPTPENPEDEDSHTPIQRRILQELRNLQEAEQLNPQTDDESRRKFLSNFDWKDSILQQHEIRKIESLLIEYQDIFARHIRTTERIKFYLNNPKTLYCANSKPKFRTKTILKNYSSKISDTNTTLTTWTE